MTPLQNHYVCIYIRQDFGNLQFDRLLKSSTTNCFVAKSYDPFKTIPHVSRKNYIWSGLEKIVLYLQAVAEDDFAKKSKRKQVANIATL